MPFKKDSKRDQAQDPYAVNQTQYGATTSFGGYDGYTQTGYDGYGGYTGYDAAGYTDPQQAYTQGYDQGQGYEQGYEDEVILEPMGKKRGAGFYAGISLIAVALMVGIFTGVTLFMSSTQIIPSHRSGLVGQLDGKTKEEIQAELDRVVEQGMFNIAIANVVQLQNGNSEGEFMIENSPANHYNMQVDVALADTGEVVYKSGILEPNFHIQYAKLDTPLPRGTYNCIATFHALDPKKNDAEVGQAAAAMTIVVNN